MKAAEAAFKAAGKDVKLEQQERALIAVQGPGTAKVKGIKLYNKTSVTYPERAAERF